MFRDGEIIVVVPTMTKHNDGHVMHYDDFIAASTQQGLGLLNSLENIPHEERGIMVTSCDQRTGKFSRKKVEFADEAYWWTQAR